MRLPNTSATGGYLAPIDAAPAEDDSFDAQVQPVIAGITGLDPDLYVRPRWQETPPTQPARDVDWCAFGVIDEDADTNPTIIHDGAGNGGLGQDVEYRVETATFLASFYGPNARGNATLLRYGLGVEQNRAALRANGVSFVSVGKLAFVPEIVNQQTLRRVDIQFTLRRMISRTYAVENVVSIQGQVVADGQSVAGETAVISSFEEGP